MGLGHEGKGADMARDVVAEIRPYGGDLLPLGRSVYPVDAARVGQRKGPCPHCAPHFLVSIGIKSDRSRSVRSEMTHAFGQVMVLIRVEVGL